jgi:hypothetical protein
VCPLFELLFEIFVFFKLPICTKKRSPFVNLNFLLQSLFTYLGIVHTKYLCGKKSGKKLFRF